MAVYVPRSATPVPGDRSRCAPHQASCNNRSAEASSRKHRPGPPIRRLSPGLEARLKRFEEQRRRKEQAEFRHQRTIGRIPPEQLEELERLQRQRWHVSEVDRGGKPRRGGTRAMPAGGVRLSGGPVLTDNEASMLGSDVSSIVDISDHCVPSETDEDRDELQDKHKYRMPDIGKTRLNLLTKEPLSPGPRNVPKSPRRRENSSSRPSTPRTNHSATNGASPTTRMEAQSTWHNRNSSAENVSDSDAFVPTLSRANSVYTLGRASFTGQLTQLTSMRLPDADSLAKRIGSLPSAADAAKALSDASEQIRLWVSKASDVLEGLKADDDVEWAAAGGREGIEDVDQAINRFQRLVEVYILSIERLQTRDDISQLSTEEIMGSVGQMESIVASWKRLKDTLKGIKEQVEIAMDWEHIWNTVLGEIGQEMESLNRMVFEMEESRHNGAGSVLSSKDSIDLAELETIVEEQPGRKKPPKNNRLSVPPLAQVHSSPLAQTPPSNEPIDIEDGTLLALFARMQPLRASLDFLPMRLSAWHARGSGFFPSACDDLDKRREQLESDWNKLEADAESLRRELGEDRWVMVFRNAGRQALKMCESITRSYSKLKDAVDANEQRTNPASLVARIENYEQKKRHYGPAVERVLAIIDRGVADRLTVNGEILRLQSDMKGRWTSLQMDMADMDLVVDTINQDRDKHIRDSVSTVLSSERSIASSLVDTPGSSPASSIVGGSRKSSFGSRTPTPLTNIKTRSSSANPRDRLSVSSSLPRKGILHKPSITNFADRLSSAKSSPSSIPTPSKQPQWPSRPEPQLGNKPRFHSLAKGENRDFRPLSAFEPSPYAKTPVKPKANYLRSTTPAPKSPATRIVSAPDPLPPTSLPRPTSVMGTSRKSSLPVPAATPSKASAVPSLKGKASTPALKFQGPASVSRPSSRLTSGRRSSMMPARPVDGNEADNESPSYHKTRPPSALASGRRSSILPFRARSRLGDATDEDGKPKWRP